MMKITKLEMEMIVVTLNLQDFESQKTYERRQLIRKFATLKNSDQVSAQMQKTVKKINKLTDEMEYLEELLEKYCSEESR